MVIYVNFFVSIKMDNLMIPIIRLKSLILDQYFNYMYALGARLRNYDKFKENEEL